MTPRDVASHLFEVYDHHRRNDLSPSNCRHGVIVPEILKLAGSSKGFLSAQEAGRSLEGRSILNVSFGHGPTSVLLWSQMHGDEPTATLAIIDMLEYLLASVGEDWVQMIDRSLTVHIIPMLNPDGAERFRRFTAADVDMNRDARALVTPEARILRDAQKTFLPEFGFNLHDQGLSSVGSSPHIAAMSLLAPALDDARTTPMGRIKAMRVGALIAHALSPFAEGHLATYDDSYEPRAFGDGMQSWGTSTLLIESGHWPNDPEKKFVRKLNFVALLTCLEFIGDGSYQHIELDAYRSLIPNGRRAFDIIVRGVTIRDSAEWTGKVDIGLLAVPEGERTSEFGGPQSRYAIKEIGDLRDFGALSEIDANARSIESREVRIEKTVRIEELRGMLQL